MYVCTILCSCFCLIIDVLLLYYCPSFCILVVCLYYCIIFLVVLLCVPLLYYWCNYYLLTVYIIINCLFFSSFPFAFFLGIYHFSINYSLRDPVVMLQPCPKPTSCTTACNTLTRPDGVWVLGNVYEGSWTTCSSQPLHAPCFAPEVAMSYCPISALMRHGCVETKQGVTWFAPISSSRPGGGE